MSDAEQEDREAEEKSSPSAHVVYEAIRIEGRHELERKVSSLAWSGLAAGMSMGFSFLVQALLRQHLPDSPWAPLIIKLGYAAGFLIVILGRQQLFTENTLTVILPLLLHKTKSDLFKVLRLWTVVLGANLLGAFAFGWVAAKTGAFEPEVRATLDMIARDGTGQTFALNFLRGIFAGWLIALMVWLLPAAETARIWVIIIVTYLVGLGHFPHIIAGAVEAFYAGLNGLRTWTELIASYGLPTLIGNTIGGVTLVAVLAHAQIVGDKEKQKESPIRVS
ncbi:MAG: formate/nitrite transporter family protein [Chthoniobacterales bacterium]